VDQEYILRVQTTPRRTLSLWMSAKGELAVEGGQRAPLTILRQDASGLVTVQWGERILSGILRRDGRDLLHIEVHGERIIATLRPAALDAMEQGISAAQSANGTLEIRSPIPGLVKVVSVRAGELVEAGQKLIMLEAMKMENDIVAPHKGALARVEVAAGQAVAAGALLATIKVLS